jgi:hypothetical protein
MYGISSVNVLCCAVFRDTITRLANLLSLKRKVVNGASLYIAFKGHVKSMDNERIKSQDDVFADTF